MRATTSGVTTERQAVITAADKQIWRADAPVPRVLRRVGDRWIDYGERSEDWYEPGTDGPGPVGPNRPVRLIDPVRRISLELFDDRLEVSHANAAPGVAATGRWISAAELPAFAKRPPAAKQPDPLCWRGTTWHALVLDGNSSISLPLPPEIARPGADFTIEMWARFDAGHPESHLVIAEPLQLHTLRPRLVVGGPPSMLMADLKSGPLGIAVRPPVLGDRWHHWAIVRAGRQLRLFIDGQPRAALPLDEAYVIRSPTLLLGGRGTQQGPNLRGMIRAVRVSGVARYAQSFRPPLRLEKDPQTFVLPQFQAAAGDVLEDLSGHGHAGSRGTAQWLPLTPDEGIVQAELPADYVDLERTLAADMHTLRGTTEGNASWHDTTSAQGICQMLIPYQPQGDYDLELEVERLEGEGGVLLGVVFAHESTQAALGVNVYADQGGPYSGVLPADLKLVAPQPRLLKHEPILRTGQRQQITVQVRNLGSTRYSLQMLVDGQTIWNLSDYLTSSALSPDLKLPQRAGLFWGSQNAKVRLHSLRLLPRGRQTAAGAIAGAAVPPASGTAPPGGGNVSSGSSSPSVAASGRPTAQAAMAGKAWLADEPIKRAVRLVGGRWVEVHERDEFWYTLREASPGEFVLADDSRKVELRLRDGEVAIRTPSQQWASLGPGRWVDAGELPPFAQRPLGSRPTDPNAFHEPDWHALVFDGRTALRLPLPPDFLASGRDFTIEAWLRFDPWSSRQMVRLLNLSALGAFVVPAPPAANLDSRELHLVALRSVHRFPVTLEPDRWKHLAIVRSAGEIKLFMDGGLIAAQPVSEQFTLEGRDPTLSFGVVGGGPGAGFMGLLRDLRVSQVARYASPFTPPLRSVPDADTIALPKLLADPKPVVENLASGGPFLRSRAQWVALSHWGELAGWRPDGSLDLSRLFSVGHHTVIGSFERHADYTDSQIASGPALVLVPHRPPANYDVELEATRLEGEGGVLLGLMLGEQQALLGLDLNAAQGRRSGILLSDLAQIKTNTNLTSHEPLLVTGARHRFTVKVRQPAGDTYSVEVSHNGSSRVATLQGKIAQVAAPPAWSMRLATGMCLGSFDAKVRFHSLVLRPASDAASPPLAATTGTADLASSVPAGTSSSATPAAAVPRQPVPSADDVAQRLADARKAFEAELREATRPAQKAVLARHILTAAESAQGDATARYVLVDLARKVFIQAGDVNDALAAARTLEKEFEIPEDKLVIETVAALDEGTLPPDERTALAQTAIDLAEHWLDRDDFDRADKLAAIASQSAGKQRDADLRKEIVQRRGQVVRVATAARAVQASLAVLQTQPADPAANLAVGKFHCLVREDWKAGLPCLAKGGDPLFAAPAGLDLATSSGKPTDLAAAGEAWLKLAADTKTIGRDDRPALQRRAKGLLTAALPGLIGLERIRIEKRLEELSSLELPVRPGPSRKRS